MEDVMLGQGAETSAPVESVSAPVETSTPTERTFRQSEVNEIVGRVRQEASQKAARSHTEQAQSQPSQSSNVPSEDHYRKIAAEEAQRLRDHWVADAQSRSEQDSAQRIVQNFWDKVATGKEKYDDFEQVTSDIEYSKFPNTVALLADHVDNTDEVLYELGKDRLKMSQIEMLAERSPRDAMVHMKRLADSIKNNQAASRMRTPNAPLSQQRPSSTGTDAGGPLSMAQLKARYKG